MCQSGEMNDCVHSVDISWPIDLIFQIGNLDLLNALYPRRTLASCSEHSIFPIQQMRNEMAPEKTGCTGNQNGKLRSTLSHVKARQLGGMHRKMY